MKGNICLRLRAQGGAAKAYILVAAAIALVSPPAQSQGLMTPGGAPTATRPHVTPGAKDSAGPPQWSASTSIPGVLAIMTDTSVASGGRAKRAISNRDGVLTLGALSEGTYEVAIELPRGGSTQPERQQILVGVLVPSTQALVGTSAWIRALKGKVTISVGPKGDPRAVTSTEGMAHKDTWDVNKFGPVSGRDVKLVFLLPSNAQP
ncbi:MAG: hypothetical protein Q8K93_08170 [Reyranella sp.]|nr:hypothetical protein [Reyranella sp.]